MVFTLRKLGELISVPAPTGTVGIVRRRSEAR